MSPELPRTPADGVASNEPMLTEGLPIRRVGAVAQATVRVKPDAALRESGRQREEAHTPITLPAQFYMGDGWQLTHLCPSSGAEVQQNWLVPLFHNTLYLNSICLHTYELRNPGLLDSIASVFDRLQPEGDALGARYGYAAVPQRMPLPGFGGTPNLLYYQPLQGTGEQFLLLYDRRYAPHERADEDPSFVNVYELVQVELDEAVFLRLLQEALDAGYRAHP